MKRMVRAGRALAFLVVTGMALGCETTTPPSRTVAPSPAPSVAPSPVPTGSPVAAPAAWIRSGIDPGPGPNVVGAIADYLGVPAANVTAAVLMFEHPAGNQPFIWLFRASGVASADAIERWVEAETRCTGSPVSVTLANLPGTLVHRKYIDQCQPEYLVALDGRTVAMIVDDGGYQGNDPANPTPVPYRSTDEIAALVVWLQQNRADIPLATGGPPLNNG